MDSKQFNEEYWKKQVKKDVKFIKNEIIARQPNGNYCKFSTALNAVSTYNMTETQYLRYWKNIYGRFVGSKPFVNTILKACKTKLYNNTISIDEMIDKVEKSAEYEKEKKNIIKFLRGIEK